MPTVYGMLAPYHWRCCGIGTFRLDFSENTVVMFVQNSQVLRSATFIIYWVCVWEKDDKIILQ